MVLQDAHMDYRSSVYSMITNTDDDDDGAEQLRTPHIDSLVWELIRIVHVDDFVVNDLNSALHQPLENKLSGGQKTRLLLARALYRAYRCNSSILILDEPDKGLPAETTVSIVSNIVHWYRSRGILFLTLHTEETHTINFDQVLQIEQGTITKMK